MKSFEPASSSSGNSNSSDSQQNILLPFLRKSRITAFLSNLLKLASFLNTSMEPYPILSATIFIIHMIQYWALSLFMFDLSIWDQHSLPGNTISVLSILIRLFPAFKETKYITTVACFYSVFYTAFLIYIIVVAKMFSKSNHIHQYIITSCSYLIPFLGFVWQPIAVTTIIEIFYLPDKSVYEYVLAGYSCAILILFSILYILNSSWSVFIVSPLPVLRDSFRLTNYFSIIILAALSTLVGHIDRVAKIVVYLLMILTYVFCFVLTAKYSLLQKRILESILFGVTLSSITCVIVHGIFSITRNTLPSFIIFVEVVIGAVGIILYSNYLVRHAVRNLDVLDEISDNIGTIKYYSINFIINSGSYGFIDKHPFCTSLLIFQRAIENDPTNNVWLLLLYAKYLCIYPQYFAELNKIRELITKCHSRNIFVKLGKRQLATILQRRDPSLSHSLKQHLTRIEELVNIASMRIGNAFETVSSGDRINSLNMFSAAINTIDEIKGKFRHLETYFGHNVYALHAQAKYYRYIIGDQIACYACKERLSVIKSLGFSHHDNVYAYARELFPQSLMNVHTSISIDRELDSIEDSETGEIDDDLSQNTIKNLIDEHPSHPYKIAIVFFVAIGIAFVLIPFISIPLSYPYYVSQISEIAHYKRSITSLTISLNHMVSFIAILCTNTSGLSTPLFTKNMTELIYTEAFTALDALADVTKLKYLSSSCEQIVKIKNLMFNQITLVRNYYTWSNYTEMHSSLHALLLKYIFDSALIAEKPVEYIFSKETANIYGNVYIVVNLLLEIQNLITDFALIESEKQTNLAFWVYLGVGIFLIIICIYAIFKFNTEFLKEEEQVIRCFSALPRSILKAMIEKMNITHELGSIDDIEIGIDNREAHYILNKYLVVEKDMSHTYVYFISSIVLALSAVSIFIIGFYSIYNPFNSFTKRHPLSAIGSESYVNTVLSLSHLLFESMVNTSTYHPEIDVILENYPLEIASERALSAFNKMYFGDSGNGILPLAELIESLGTNENLHCEESPIFECKSMDNVFFTFIFLIRKLNSRVSIFNEKLSLDDNTMWLYWHIMIDFLYPKLFSPLKSEIFDVEMSSLQSGANLFLTYAWIPLLFSIVSVVALCRAFIKFSRRIKNILSLLLHAPTNVLLESKYIISVISKNTQVVDITSSFDGKLSEQIMDLLNHPVVIVRLPSKILYQNESAIKLEIPMQTLLFLYDENESGTSRGSIFEIADRSFNISFFQSGSLAIYILYEQTEILELERQIENEQEEFHRIMFLIMPPNAIKKCYTDHGAIVCFTIESDSILEAFPLLIDLMYDQRPYFRHVDNIHTVYHRIFVTAGLVVDGSPSEVGSSLLSYAVNIVKRSKALQFQVPYVLRVGAVGRCKVAGRVERTVFDIISDCLPASECFSKAAGSNEIIVNQSMYEVVYGSGFAMSKNCPIHVPNIGDVMTYSISPQ